MPSTVLIRAAKHIYIPHTSPGTWRVRLNHERHALSALTALKNPSHRFVWSRTLSYFRCPHCYFREQCSHPTHFCRPHVAPLPLVVLYRGTKKSQRRTRALRRRVTTPSSRFPTHRRKVWGVFVQGYRSVCPC